MRRTWDCEFRVDQDGECVAVSTFCPLLLAPLMRDVILAMFSVSCFARWGFMCISSAMMVVQSKSCRV